MKAHGVTDVTMESTAVYWIPIWRLLDAHFRLKLVNPYFIKQLPGRKAIIECAWAASRTKDCFFSRFSYRMTQVCKKNKMKVLVAVASHMHVSRISQRI
jgi:hypothetical protein